MMAYHWKDPTQTHKDLVSSWRQKLQDHDRQNIKRTVGQAMDIQDHSTSMSGVTIPIPKHLSEVKIEEELSTITQLNRCTQVWLFPPKPELADLVPTTSLGQDKRPLTISPEDIRRMKRRKRISKTVPWNALSESQAELLTTDTNGSYASDSHQQQQGGPALTKVFIPEMHDAQDDEQELVGLEAAVSSLRSKLEILQPIGMRPSDLAAALAQPAFEDQGALTDENGDTHTNAAQITNQEEILSQVSTSQCSVYLWDELRALVTLSGSPSEKTKEQVDKAASELGLYNLEDGALDRLCTEIFDGYQTEQQEAGSSDADETRATLQLSYPASLFLFRILFYKKALLVQFKPSRLFLHSIVLAGKHHGRAVTDAVLLPLLWDHVRYSKVTSELVQNVLKEQSSVGVIHFLSMVLEPRGGQAASAAGEDNELGKVPVLFLTEVHLDTVKIILSYANVPTPLPSRLWVRFNAVLEMLWEQIVLLTSSPSSTTCQAFVKLYCSSGDLHAFLGSSGRKDVLSGGEQDSLRLSCVNLVQLLMTWTMRQGPLCQDVGNLEKMRQFCASRIDAKLGKSLVTKLDMFIKRKSKK
ncbi:unnamed protein product [Mortierella alpina]